MKERGILMNGDMVRATLREVDPKWQTRRIVKPQPPKWIDRYLQAMDRNYWIPNGPFIKDPMGALSKGACEVRMNHGTIKCPFGAPGNQLWVREAFQICEWFQDHWEPASLRHEAQTIHRFYAADNSLPDQDGLKWRPSIHMPRWASRITLEITNIRVERLQDISEEDARAEGVELLKPNFYRAYNCKEGFCTTARQSYEMLWDSINGEGSWTANPWVWVIEFRRIKP